MKNEINIEEAEEVFHAFSFEERRKKALSRLGDV